MYHIYCIYHITRLSTTVPWVPVYIKRTHTKVDESNCVIVLIYYCGKNMYAIIFRELLISSSVFLSSDYTYDIGTAEVFFYGFHFVLQQYYTALRYMSSSAFGVMCE